MPEIIEGAITAATKNNLIRGVRGKPLTTAAAEEVTRQARELIQKAADRYEQDVAPGEVGAHGTASASADTPAAGRGPSGLLYGRVQSGKTAAMTMAAAVALDNGFRIVVVVTANNLALVRQTADRFKAVAGPRVFSTLKDLTGYEWDGQEGDLRQDLPQDGLVIVCAKDRMHLPAVIRLLQQLEAAAVPALIFDDEADAATPDTTLGARSAGRANAPPHESTTYRYVIDNTAPGQEGESLRETLPHHVFIQVTATPYVLFLQREDAPIRPSFVHVLEPGVGYCGGREFFESFDPTIQPAAPPIVVVPASEAQALLAARNSVPTGLANSCNFFLLAAAAHSLTLPNQRFPEKGYKHLSHTSPRTNQHDRVADLINGHVRAVRHLLREPNATEARTAFEAAYGELRRALGETTPALDRLLSVAANEISQAEVVRVNMQTGAPEFGPSYNFVVGGNILARGLTIDDLLVTYYLREAKTPQMDTVWQHARMYGYRAALMPYTRVYLPSHLATLFRQIHESEEQLRALLAEPENVARIPILTPGRARATRPAALESGVLQVYGGPVIKQIVPYYAVTDPASVGDSAQRIAAILQQSNVPLAESVREQRFRDAPLDVMKQIVQIIPIRDDDDGRWDTDAVLALLDATAEAYGQTVSFYVRPFEPGDNPNMRRVRGVLSGPEVTMAESRDRFVLALTYTGDATAPTAWYPTLIVPRGMPPHVFNPL
jgi:Z1 domain